MAFLPCDKVLLLSYSICIRYRSENNITKKHINKTKQRWRYISNEVCPYAALFWSKQHMVRDYNKEKQTQNLIERKTWPLAFSDHRKHAIMTKKSGKEAKFDNENMENLPHLNFFFFLYSFYFGVKNFQITSLHTPLWY